MKNLNDDAGHCCRTGEVMCTASTSQCDGQMGVHGTDGLRQQLQAKVSGSLADRGVSTSDRWSVKPKTKVRGNRGGQYIRPLEHRPGQGQGKRKQRVSVFLTSATTSSQGQGKRKQRGSVYPTSATTSSQGQGKRRQRGSVFPTSAIPTRPR